ncbi:hypothetical protein C8J57DRAFT_1185240 [Mycena rebaudengoi]|nr:hypothetical protein C8J57DRAFT_1185240 [Mycena rebaudengoi]
MADSSTGSTRYLPSEIRTNISALDARILALESSLAAARCERANLQSQLDDYKYPVLTLPIEVTAEIFVNFLPIYPSPPPLTGLLSPALLGRICRQWRDVALSTPQLWRAVVIHIPRNAERSISEHLNTLNTWLIRSRNCPLSISLAVDEVADCPNPWTDAIMIHAARWEHMNLFAAFDDLCWIHGPLPLLCALTLGPSELAGLAPTAFLDVPALTTVPLFRAQSPIPPAVAVVTANHHLRGVL